MISFTNFTWSLLAILKSFNSSIKSSFTLLAGDVSAFKEVETYFLSKDAIVALGLNISNTGPKINYTNSSEFKYFLPTNIKFGTSL